eukprot:CFRG0790T1
MEVRHKQEKRELLSSTTQLKNSVPKKDKKKMKETNQLIARMQQDLAVRQKLELELAAEGVADNDLDNAVQQKLQEMSLKSAEQSNGTMNDRGTTSANASTAASGQEDCSAPEGDKSKSKSQRRRERKEEEAKLNQIVAERNAVNNPAPDLAKNERFAFIRRLTPLGITIHDIPADGDCLYAAIADQLKRQGRTLDGELPTASSLRKLAADHIRDNREDFLPYCLDDDGEMVSADQFDKYCNKVERSKQWGGQLELRAIAEGLHTSIVVYQAETDELPIAIADSVEKALLVSYHKHAYTLGAHYNSLILGD